MRQLIGELEVPAYRAIGFDTDTCLTAQQAARFHRDRYQFCLRYLSRGGERRHDLTYREAQIILDSGLALMPVQHVVGTRWIPDGKLGAKCGEAAALNARAVGFPKGVNVWCDLENTKGGEAHVVAFCKAWHKKVQELGYVPGLYVGAACGLNALELEALPFKHYWRSNSASAPRVARRSYQLWQGQEKVSWRDGVLIDVDKIRKDLFGGHVIWLRRPKCDRAVR